MFLSYYQKDRWRDSYNKMKNIIVRTTNKEIYKKFNLLNFLDEVVINNVNSCNLNKMINRINKKQQILEVKNFGNYFVIKKQGPYTFSVSLK